MWASAPLPPSKTSVGVRFTHTSPDGDEGYPGEVTIALEVSINNQNELKFSYTATVAGKATPINVTNHSYWNLSGDCKATVGGHWCQLFCDNYTPVNEFQVSQWVVCGWFCGLQHDAGWFQPAV